MYYALTVPSKSQFSDGDRTIHWEGYSPGVCLGTKVPSGIQGCESGEQSPEKLRQFADIINRF